MVDKPCMNYCSHGGVCTLTKDHSGKHDASGMCQWDDAESISKEEADEKFLLEAKYQGIEGFAELTLILQNFLEDQINKIED